MVEQVICNHLVGVRLTVEAPYLGVAQVVVRLIWVQEVGGSSPLTQTKQNTEVGDLMLVSEAAKKLGMNTQTLRLALQQERFDFGTAVKTSPKRWTYYICEKRLERYLEGVDYEKISRDCSAGAVIDKLWTEDDTYY